MHSLQYMHVTKKSERQGLHLRAFATALAVPVWYTWYR